ncbi:MAG TPA: cellulose synthase, partial [Coleofasciculaceae cyanobacterium]
IPDEVRIELVGDYGARALLDARIVRGIATDKLQAILSVDFINLSRTQLDDLMVVLYSDVREWYSQRRTETDKPFQSLQFIATSLRRAFRELKPADELKVRKQVRTTAQLFWEEWEGTSYLAKVNEMGMHDLRLEVSGIPAFQLDLLQDSNPTIALLMNLGQNTLPQSLLAQVETVEVLGNVLEPELQFQNGVMFRPANDTLPPLRVSIELSFPAALDRQQQAKIRQILRSLG